MHNNCILCKIQFPIGFCCMQKLHDRILENLMNHQIIHCLIYLLTVYMSEKKTNFFFQFAQFYVLIIFSILMKIPNRPKVKTESTWNRKLIPLPFKKRLSPFTECRNRELKKKRQVLDYYVLL